MANQQDTIDILIRAEDQASAAISSTVGALSSLGKGVLAADAAVVAMAATLGVMAVKETVQFQDSLYLVQKQLGDTGVSIEQARQDIEGLALQYGTNANEVAASVADFLAAGYDYKTSAELVKTSTALMIAGQLDASTATDAINKSLAGFRIPAEDAAEGATKVGDVLNKIGDISSGKFEEIVQGFTRISPTAKDAGLTMEETAASIAVLVDVFGSGEIAATALKSGLLSLQVPSNEAKDVLDSLSVSLTGSNGELRSSKDIIGDLAGKWGTLTDAQKQQTATVIFGKDQAGAMSALLGDWGKQQDYVAQMLDKTTGATGSMAKEVEGKLKLISSSLAITSESWRQFLERLGSKVVEGGGLQSLIDNIGKLGLSFKGLVDGGALDPLLNLLKTQISGLSDLIAKVAQNLPAAFAKVDLSGLVKSFEGLGGAIGGLFGDIDLTTVDGLAKALQSVVDGAETLVRVTSGMVEALKPFLGAIMAGAEQFANLDAESQSALGGLLGFAMGAESAFGAIGTIGSIAGGTVGFVADLRVCS